MQLLWRRVVSSILQPHRKELSGEGRLLSVEYEAKS